MNNNDDIYCFCVGRYDLMSLSWFIGGFITWRKTKTNVPIMQELLYNWFFSLSFKPEKELQRGNADSRLTNQFKVIHTENVKSYPDFKISVFEKKHIRTLQDFIERDKVVKAFYFLAYVYENLDEVRDTSFPIISANTRIFSPNSLFPLLSERPSVKMSTVWQGGLYAIVRKREGISLCLE